MVILYCTNSLWTNGGIERVSIAKANALAALDGYEVVFAVADNRYPPIIPLDNRVRIVDLGLTYHTADNKRRYLPYIMALFKENRLHARRLKKCISEIGPDVIISTDGFGKYFIPFLQSSPDQVLIREYHMWSKFHLLEPKNLFERMLGWFGSVMDVFLIRKYDKYVLLTNEDKALNWKNHSKVIVIPNPYVYTVSSVSSLDNKTVSAIGRLCRQKNFGLLIDSWSFVNRLHPDWKLNIWGDGPDRDMLQDRIHSLGLEDVVLLKGTDSNIPLRLASSSMCAMSSLYEGVPLVIIEAMSCGLPVVSTTFHGGPKDIICDGSNGFLVPQNDPKALAEHICTLIEDADLRKRMGEKALDTSRQFQMDTIIKKWTDLFDELTKCHLSV